MDNAPQYRLHWMWDIPLASPLEGHCSILNSLAKTGLKNFGFVTSKKHHYFPSFPASYLSLSLSYFLSYYTIVKFCFPFILITEYWLYSPCCTIHPWAHLTPETLYLQLLQLCIAPSPLHSSLVTSRLFYLWAPIFVIFSTLWYFKVL